MNGRTGRIPYYEVVDLEASEYNAHDNRGVVVDGRRRGPAGEYVIVKDPGCSRFALRKRS